MNIDLKNKIAFFIIGLIVLSIFSESVFANTKSPELTKARKKYYQAVQEEDYVLAAEKEFLELKKDARYAGLSATYLGSITALKAKYAFWPNTKLSLANKGIEEMESGLKKDPENIESLFIYGSTCFYLPFFFDKEDDSVTALKKIIELYPKRGKEYEPEIVENALLFILNEVDITETEKKKIYKYLGELKKA
ncbi:MAG: hypothetical protein Kapaf2KO_02250 [Candidatus Kapaibacteriales bacterium]